MASVAMLSASTTSPGYDLVLLAHVLSAVVGLVALSVAAGSALALRGALRRGGPVPEALARYYRPGVNWAGRVLFLVPVFGIVLLVMSGGQWGFADTWVSAGMAVWAVVAMTAEAALWPEERRLQLVVAAVAATADVASEGAAGGTGDGRGDVGGTGDGRGDVGGTPGHGGGADLEGAPGRCVRVGLLGAGLGAALVAVAVLMVAKP